MTVPLFLCVTGVVLALETAQARVSAGVEADSNARRDVGGEVPRPDVVGRSQLGASAWWAARGHRLTLDGNLGAKLFTHERTEDLLVAETRARHESWLWERLALFVDVGGRDRRQRSGLRSYTSASMDLGGVVALPRGLTVVASAGPRSFVFWPDARFHHAGAGTVLSGLWRPTAAETLSAFAGLDARGFPWAPPATGTDDAGNRVFDQDRRRLDGSGYAEVAVESARTLYLRGAYRLSGNASNSVGEQYLKHRLQFTAGTLLPGGVRVLAEAQLQATRWPNGLGLGERLALQDADENQSSASVQLSVPLPLGLWLETRAAAYTAELSAARTPFLRITAFGGLGYRI